MKVNVCYMTGWMENSSQAVVLSKAFQNCQGCGLLYVQQYPWFAASEAPWPLSCFPRRLLTLPIRKGGAISQTWSSLSQRHDPSLLLDKSDNQHSQTDALGGAHYEYRMLFRKDTAKICDGLRLK